MVEPRRWGRVVSVLVPVEMLLLLTQYGLGLWTNLYAPAQFSSNTSFPALDWHYMIGDTLFVVAVLILIFGALARRASILAPAIVLVIAIFLAGMFGADFVSSTPNNPIDSFWMGVMFLVALFSLIGVGAGAWRSGRMQQRWTPSPTPPSPGQPSS